MKILIIARPETKDATLGYMNRANAEVVDKAQRKLDQIVGLLYFGANAAKVPPPSDHDHVALMHWVMDAAWTRFLLRELREGRLVYRSWSHEHGSPMFFHNIRKPNEHTVITEDSLLFEPIEDSDAADFLFEPDQAGGLN